MSYVVECSGCVGRDLSASFRRCVPGLISEMDGRGNFRIFHADMDPCDFDSLVADLSMFLRENCQESAKFLVIRADMDEMEFRCGLISATGLEKIDLAGLAVDCAKAPGPA